MADSGLSVSLYIDAKKNNEFKDTVGGFTYKAKLVSGEAVIRLDSKMILDRWKGTTRITTAPWPDFEYASTFAPVFLVLDIANNGRRNAQITGTYVDIEASHTDLRPYIQMWANSGICVSDFNLDLSLTNNGWGSARHATLTFAFGDESGPKTKEMVIDVGDLAFRTDLATEDSIKALGVDTDTLTKGDYRCSSEEEYARCLADWKNSDLLAPLKGAVFSYNTLLLTRLWGDLSFSWTDFAGAVHKQTRPVAGDVLLLDVNAALPECGGLQRSNAISPPSNCRWTRPMCAFRSNCPIGSRRVRRSATASTSSPRRHRIIASASSSSLPTARPSPRQWPIWSISRRG